MRRHWSNYHTEPNIPIFPVVYNRPCEVRLGSWTTVIPCAFSPLTPKHIGNQSILSRLLDLAPGMRNEPHFNRALLGKPLSICYSFGMPHIPYLIYHLSWALDGASSKNAKLPIFTWNSLLVRGNFCFLSFSIVMRLSYMFVFFFFFFFWSKDTKCLQMTKCIYQAKPPYIMLYSIELIIQDKSPNDRQIQIQISPTTMQLF